MAIIKSFSPKLNLSNYGVFLNDTRPASQYFRISEFQDVFTGGKNAFLIEGTEFLKKGTEIKIEILDVEGNTIYFEPGDGVPEYYEGNSKLVSVHVYEDTPIGIGKITILGELETYIDENGVQQDIPTDWRGIYNVKWERQFQVNKNLNNETRVRFYKRPLVTITELVKPIFSKSVPSVTRTGYVHGIADTPPSGTDITTWRAGTTYKLQLTSGSWDRDVDENVITISALNYSPKIIEVLNDREVLVDVPYQINNLVSNFTSGSYSVTFSDFNNETIGESSLTGSFAKIDITQLKTFVGDVARVKVFRKSRNTAGDFQLVDESKLEASELLKDVTTQTNTELSYGRFDETNLSNNWISSSNDHPLSIDSSVLSQAVKIDYDNSVGGVQRLITSQSFNISQDVEYTLKFKTLLSGSITTTTAGSSVDNSTCDTTMEFADRVTSLTEYDCPAYSNAPDVFFTMALQDGVNRVAAGNFVEGAYYKFTFSRSGYDDVVGFWKWQTQIGPLNDWDTGTENGHFGRQHSSTLADDLNTVHFSTTDAFGTDFRTSLENLISRDSDNGSCGLRSNPLFGGYDQWTLVIECGVPEPTTFTTTGKSLRAFLSSSNFTQDFTTISGSAIYKTRQDESHNLLSQNTGEAKLVFEVKGDDWYISNASLKNAQDTSFSPDEITVVQDIPRKTASETFDFKFEFYDINNNYIPVDVETVGTFDGGNDFPSSGKLLTFESDRNAFRFSSGSVANPTNQTIKFSLTQNGLTGSATFASSAFDIDGNYLSPSDYTQYPGKLTNVTTAGALVTLANFTGSRVDGLPTPFVGSVIYTASLENLQEFETVYRLEDGDNAPQLIVTSNANQFIYEPTTLSPKPSGQSITVRAQRKNLASLITPIEVNSGSNLPELTFVETVGGIDTYTISATAFSQSFAANNFDEVTYSFTGSDVFGNSQSDEITISKVINFDAVSLVLSNESTSFPAKSTGEVIGGFVASSGSVQMFVGGTEIQHNEGLGTRNRFDITSISGTNVTPTSTSPTTKNYSISAFQTNKDSGSLALNIEYLAGDNATSQSFQKVVSYTKAKKAVPNVLTKTTPSTQTINSGSTGFETPQTVEVIVQEGGTEYNYQSSLSGGESEAQKFEILSVHSGSNSNEIITVESGTYPTYPGTVGSASIQYVDSEGTLVQNKTVRFDVSVSKVGQDGAPARAVKLTFSDNSISYNADGGNPDPASVTLIASASNFIDPVFKFTGGGSNFTDETSFTAGVGSDNDTATFTLPNAYSSSPYTFTVFARESANSSIEASDSETLNIIKPGLDIRPRFFIKPLNGTQIKNASGNIELQVVKIDGTGSFEISGSSQGDAQLYSGSTILATSMTGIDTGSNISPTDVTYNAVFAPSSISGSKLISLKETDGTLLDTITLLDVTDGLAGGSFISPSGSLLRLQPGGTYSPTSIPITASFFDVQQTEYQASVVITPNFNGVVDRMKVGTQSGDSDITITATDGDGNTITLGDSNFTTTKDVVLNATFIDPVTQRSTQIQETYYIISDGRDGTSAKLIRLLADSQIFAVAQDGTISPSTINLSIVNQNITGSISFNATNGVSLGGSGNTRTLASSEFAGSISSSIISVTGSQDGTDFTDEITIVKLSEGTDGLTISNENQAHSIPATNQGVALSYANSGTTIKLFEGTTALDYDGVGSTAGHWTVYTSSNSDITTGQFTESGNDVIVGNHSAMGDAVTNTTIEYFISGSKLNGDAFILNTTQTISKINEGLDAITVTNENTNHSFLANSAGTISSFTGGGTDIQVFEGDTALTFTTGTAGNGEYTVTISNEANFTEGTASGNASTTCTISAPSAMTTDSVVVTYTIEGKRQTGEIFSAVTTQTFTRITPPPPSVNISVNPQSQTVSYSTASGYGTPSAVTIKVSEGGTDYTHDSSGSPANQTFNITDADNGTDNDDGTITPPTISSAAGATETIELSYKTSEGLTTTGQTITYNVGVASQGSDGSSGVVVTPTINNQSITRDLGAATFGTVEDIEFSVTQGSTSFSAVASNTALTNNKYRVKAGSLTNCSESSIGTVTPTQPSANTFTNGGNATFTIEYKDGNGDTNEVSFTHSVTVVLEGTNGPGVVMTGVWENNRVYQLSSGSGARRDVVLWSSNGNAPYDTYYGATKQHTSVNTNSVNGAPDESNSTAWESFGTADFFVAAKIGVFEESFVQNTLNIGTNNSGGASVANITLSGGSAHPYFSLGQNPVGTYGGDGIFIGRDSADNSYKASFVNGTTAFMKWNGASLEIKGAITATSGTFTGNINASGGTFTGNVSAGNSKFGLNVHSTNDGLLLDSNVNSGAGYNYWYDDGSFRVGGASDFMTWDGTDLQIQGDLDVSSGTITGATLSGAQGSFSGNVTATSITATGTGTIAGFTLSGSSLIAGTLSIIGGSSPSINMDSGKLNIFPGTLSSLGAGTGAFSGNISTSTSVSSYGVTNAEYQLSSTSNPTFLSPGNISGTYIAYSSNVSVSAGSTATATFNGDLTHGNAILGTNLGTNYEVTAFGSNSLNMNVYIVYRTFKAGIILSTSSTSGGITSGNTVASQEYTIGGLSCTGSTTNLGQAYAVNCSIYNQAFSLSASVTAGVTYYAYTYAKELNIQNMQYGPGQGQIDWTLVSPKTANIALTIPVTKTELTTGGFQTVHSNTNYFRVELNSSYNNISTVSALVGGSLEATGNITANTSDKRFKNVHGNIETPIEKIKKLNGVVYHSNELAKKLQIHEERQQVGLLAQELEEVLPEAVTRAPFDNDGKGNSKTGENYLTIWYERVVPLLVEGIKELTNQVDDLKDEIKELRGNQNGS